VLNYSQLEEKSNEELFALYKETGSQEVKQELTMRYVYIVRSIAYQMREMYNDFMQTDDIVNEGVIEIMRAIERYDESKDNKFETFISRRIRGMVIDMMRKNDWLPRNFHKDSRSIEAANLELNNRLGRAPTDEELADYLNMNVKKLQKIQRMSNMVNVLSLDMTYDEGNETLLQIPSEDHSTQPEFSFMQKENVSCNLIRGYIDNAQEAHRMLDFALSLGVPRIGFVALMKLNQYCCDHFVDLEEIFWEKIPHVYFTNSMNRGAHCKCSNYLYNKNLKILEKK